MFLYPAVLPRAHTLLKEADDRAVFGHIPCPCCRDTLRLGKAIAVVDDRLQCLYSFVHDAVALCVHFVKQLLVLPVFRDNIRAEHYHDPVVDPLAVVAAELRQPVHTEPEQTVVGKLKRLLAFELGIEAVAAGDLFKGLQLVHSQKAHIRGTGEACAVDRAGAETGLDLLQVNADEVALAEQPLHKAFELGFARIAVAYEEQGLFQPPALDVGNTYADEFQQQPLDCGIAVRKLFHIRIKHRCRLWLARPVARDLDRGIHGRRVRDQDGIRFGDSEQTVLEIDQVFVGIKLLLTYIVEIGGDVLQGFCDLAHLDQLLVIIGNTLLDNAHEHIVGIQPVAAVLVDIFQKPLLAVIPNEDVIQMLPNISR